MVTEGRVSVLDSAGSTVVDAIQISQAGHRVFLTALTAKQLADMTIVDPYNSSLRPGDPQQGYQRPPERSRITRIGTYLLKGLGDGLYPNAVLLGSRRPLLFDALSRRLELPDEPVLRVIDGQHRIEGLRYAIYEKGSDGIAFLDVPVVIVEIQDRTEEMNQFRIINGTAKSVRTDLVNSILTAIAEEQGSDAISERDQWRVVVTKTVDALNRREDSPWQGILLMPDEVGVASSTGKITRATSAITSTRFIYDWLVQVGFLSGNLDDQVPFLTDLLVAYWRAIRNVVPEAFSEPGEYVIQKTPGLFSLHYLLRDKLLGDIYRGRRLWDEPTFQEFVEVSPEISDTNFWHKDSNRAAAYGSMKGFRELANLLIDSITL